MTLKWVECFRFVLESKLSHILGFDTDSIEPLSIDLLDRYCAFPGPLVANLKFIFSDPCFQRSR